MTYSVQTWSDNNSAFPVSAARMAHIETGVFDAHVRPSARAYRSSAQSIATGTWDSASFDVERYDNDGIWVIGSPTRFTIQEAGIYLLWGQVAFSVNATGQRGVRLRVNGATIAASIQTNTNATDTTQIVCSSPWQMAAADYMEVQVFQASGGALNLAASGATNSATEGSVALLSYL